MKVVLFIFLVITLPIWIFPLFLLSSADILFFDGKMIVDKLI
jgi:hypothetical protein